MMLTLRGRDSELFQNLRSYILYYECPPYKMTQVAQLRVHFLTVGARPDSGVRRCLQLSNMPRRYCCPPPVHHYCRRTEHQGFLDTTCKKQEVVWPIPVGKILSPNNELMAVDFPLLVRPKNATWMWNRAPIRGPVYLTYTPSCGLWLEPL